MNVTIISKELPEEKELVLVKITKIMPYGAYCELQEYKKDAYLPISEIASGWIKNIHEFIKEGQKTVAKVLSVDKEKKTIDVSLKKATQKEKTDKQNEFSIEKRYEKLFEQALILSKQESKKDKIKQELSEKFITYTNLFNKLLEDQKSIDFIKNKQFSESLLDIISKNIKPKKYIVSYTVELKIIDPKVSIKKLKTVLEEINKKGIDILYLGAPKYRFTTEGEDYISAENKIKESKSILEKNNFVFFNMKND
ncbi:MAG: S1 RNA-binding domain-containing protein [Candidatus Micrarchaeaceae archaeon]